MEHTYGLAITIDMVMTSILLAFLLMLKYPKAKYLYLAVFVVFLLIEGVFLLSNLGKIVNGGWFTLILASSFLVYFICIIKHVN